MTYLIGIDRTIYPEWMNFSASLFLEGISIDEARQKIDEYLLNCQVKSPETRRKSKNVLINIWFKAKDQMNLMQYKEKLRIMDNKEKIQLYMQLLRNYYPFFDDLCKIILRLEKLDSEVKTADITRRMYEIWGETARIKAVLTKAIRTYRLFKNAMEN